MWYNNLSYYTKKGRPVMKEYSKRRSFWALVGALMLVVASTALLVTRYFEDKAHYEKWKDYEECGI